MRRARWTIVWLASFGFCLATASCEKAPIDSLPPPPPRPDATSQPDADTDAGWPDGSRPGDAGFADALPADAIVASDAQLMDGPDGGVGDATAPDADLVDADLADAGPADIGRPDGGAGCPWSAAGALTLPNDLVNGTLQGTSRNVSTTCTSQQGTRGPEDLYTLHVPAATGVVLRTQSAADTVLALRSVCDEPLSELACNNDVGPNDHNAELRALLDPGDYHVLVDVHAFGVGGSYTLTLESFTAAPNATCTTATPVADGTSLTGEDPSLSFSTSTPRCPNGSTLSGNLLYYSASVPPDHRLTVTVSAQDRYELALLDGCVASQCLASDPRSGSLIWDNVSANTVDVVLAVGPAFAGRQSPFDLSVGIDSLATNSDCNRPRAVVPGATLAGEDIRLGGAGSSPCAGGGANGTLFYQVTVPAGEVLRVEATPTAGNWQPRVGLFDQCTNGTCLASSPWTTGTAVASWTNNQAAATDVKIAVTNSGLSAGGTFDLLATLQPQAPNASCTSPTAVADGTQLMGEDTTRGGGTSTPCFSPNRATGLLYYSASIPAGHVLTVDAVAPGGTWSPLVAVVDGCVNATCLASGGGGGPSGPVRFANTTGTGSDVLIAVGHDPRSGGGTFDLLVQIRALSPNSICTAPTPVADGTRITAEDTSLGGSPSDPCFVFGTRRLAGVHYYATTIPADHLLRVAATPTGASFWVPHIAVFDTCTGGRCLDSSAQSSIQPNESQVVRFINSQGAPRDVVVAVGRYDQQSGGTYDLAVDIVPTAAHSDCSLALPVVDGSTVTGQDTAIGGSTSPPCFDGSPPNPSDTLAGTLFYSATIPGGDNLTVAVTPTHSHWEPEIAVMSSCSAATCLATTGSARPPAQGDPTTLRYTNAAAAPQDIVLAVGHYRRRSGGTFDMNVSIAPPPANVACASATRVVDGSNLRLQDASAGVDDLSARCIPNAMAGVLYYEATVPAGDVVRVRARPHDRWVPAIRILPNCSPGACLASGRASLAGEIAVTSYTNSTTTAHDVLIAIGSADSFSVGFFDLEVSIAPPPYAQSTVARSCDDLTTGAAIPGPTADDSASPILPLPFAFELFGEPVTGFAVSSNGFMQLFPTGGGTPSSAYGNDPIPAPAAPNGFIAAFWDDLFPPAGTPVRSLVGGTTPNRSFTVEWNDFSFFADRAARLTFQVKLFETTNVVELHYCVLQPGNNATFAYGASATVGLEDASGTDGIEHTHNTANALGTTDALRFTPGP